MNSIKNTLVWGIAALLLPFTSEGQQKPKTFSAEFAPSDNWVKTVEKPYRQELCLNGSWQFQPIALPADFEEGIDAPPELTAPKNGEWEKAVIRIPSPWNVNSFADKNGQGGDFRTFPSYPANWEKVKMGWVRRKVNVPAAWKGQRIILHFEAVAGDARILLNGKEVGGHFGIFLPFDIDVTQAVLSGKENELMIGIRKPSLFDKRSGFGRRTYQAGSFWGQHIAGIWQDVYLLAVPEIRVTDVYIKPLLDQRKLEAEVTLMNNTDQKKRVTLNADVFKWISNTGKDPLTIMVPSSALERKPALTIPTVSVEVPAKGNAKIILSAQVNNELKSWTPSAPNLYGLVIKTSADNKILDSKYSRFGWRQTGLKGNEFLLNGKPFVMKGDSWHFMGIPQMTRRYPYAWYTAMKAANLNAVRLHAQPYPSFYMDVADEMGILVLDETAVWASDGGPKLDDPAYWRDSENHLTELILRDRNHPSVIGWSISNEVMPIVRGVMRNPPGMKENLVKYYKIWADICRKTDPTRSWISADGEDDGEGNLPVYLVHYGGNAAMERGSKSAKPWGVGEAGNAYYGTPEQVSQTNGNRAYESFEGRMEGVAASSYNSLVTQAKYNAAYRSVFNLAWYGLKPLPLGLNDKTKAPTLNDGIFFTSFIEGKPGVQPERLGPYSTTLNPGYDSSLPLYQTWPLFDAIRDASAEPAKPAKLAYLSNAMAPKMAPEPLKSVSIIGSKGSTLALKLKLIGLKTTSTESGVPDLLIIDGAYPPGIENLPLINSVYTNGGTVLVLNPVVSKQRELSALLPAKLELNNRSASSLLPVVKDPVTAGLDAKSLYFSELRPSDAVNNCLAGPLTEQSAVLLRANNTDWLKWNKQDEYAKTAMVLRSELEAKPSGAVLIRKNMGKGKLFVTTLSVEPRTSKAEEAIGTFLGNLGLTIEKINQTDKPVLKTGTIVSGLMLGSFPITSINDAGEKDSLDPSEFGKALDGAKSLSKTWSRVNSENGIFDFKKMNFEGSKQDAEAYISFWMFSPRPLDNLLIEPNMPVVDLEVSADDAVKVWLNGKEVAKNIRTGPLEGGKAVAHALKLHQGWNQLVVKVIQGSGNWQFTGHFTSSQPEFLFEMDSALKVP
ncbi:glycoside hydrolase family 2 protein [Pedobacter miscanthi]|uniref:Glycoside hydrolase family 2 n=1 Tax=Pedobacter miscanthi TaxID=2259170 RepID=A0A366L1V8_9SPHI|nr:sugar-binding domain-containing protein [Pedobacter miscanthi]RBQ07868.1 glycoside hydrolase family 2 [Pedobacter miscanthi]